jgi:FtsP/CotA-like multicopper oxidase with cupredoxin domain
MQPNEIFYELTASKFDWQIAEDKTIRAWGFNQQVPGPTIKAKKGKF